MLPIPSRIQKVAVNVLFVLTTDVVNRVTTFALYALVARLLGALEFGQFSLALTLFATFQVFAVAGLKTLIARAVSRDRSLTSQYLVNSSMVVVVTSTLAIAIL